MSIQCNWPMALSAVGGLWYDSATMSLMPTMRLQASYTVSPPDWPVVMTVSAGVLLAWEAVRLAVSASRCVRWPAACLLVAASLAVGPVVVLIGLFGMAAMGGVSAGSRSRLLVRVGFLGTVLGVLGLGVILRFDLAPLAAILYCAWAWALRAYRRTTSPVTRPTKTILLALRLLIVFFLVALACRPMEHTADWQEVRGLLLIGLDRSASMELRDAPGPPGAPPVRRLDALASAMKAQQGRLAELAERADVLLYDFAASATAPSAYSPERIRSMLAGPDGRATAIGDGAQSALAATSGGPQPVVGLVVISDGCNNRSLVVTPDRLARRMATRGIPIFTVGVGSPTATGHARALSVTDLGAAENVNAYQRMLVKPTIDVVGLAGRTVEVTCTFGDETIATQTKPITKARQELALEFAHVPLHVGYHRLTVSARVKGARPDERIAGQASLSQLVHVTDREIRVLYLVGRFSYEAKFITRALESFGRISLDRRILVGDGGTALAGLGDKLEDWLRYHVILLGDLPAKALSPEQQKRIAEVVVDYGKGVGMFGGLRSFGAGGWADTPLAAVLPVDLARSTGQIEGLVQPSLTPAGEASEIMRIASEGGPTRPAWAALDAQPGANRLAGVKPAASVLAVAAGGDPLVVIQQVGKGRSLAVAFDTTWRWVLSPKDTADMQRRFWRQAVLYLAAPKGNVWAHTERTTYDLDLLEQGKEGVVVTAGIEDASGRPMRDAPMTVTLTRPDETTQAVALSPQADHRTGVLDRLTQPGQYILTAKATVGGKELTSEHRFEISRQDREQRRILADFELLQRLASETNGRFVPLHDVGSLLRELEDLCEPRQEKVFNSIDLTARWRWPIAGVLVVLLCFEWVIRKKKGLV